MYRTLIITLALLVTSMTANAAGLTAEQVLDKTVNTLDKAGAVEMSMTIRNGAESVHADLQIVKDRFRYSAGTIDVLYDGVTQWTIDNDAKEVSLTSPTSDELAETNPLAFVRSYRTKYKVSMVSESGGTYTVRMDALKKSSYVRSAQVVISSTTWLPTHVTASLASGQTLTISILSADVQKTANASGSFTFDKKNFPGYEIFDLR